MFGSRRSASEERRLERVFRSTHRCSFSHERRGNGRARARSSWERTPPLAGGVGGKGPSPGSPSWGPWRRASARSRRQVRLSSLQNRVVPLDRRLYLRSARFDRAGRRAARVAPSGNPASVTSKRRENLVSNLRRRDGFFINTRPTRRARRDASIRPARASLADPRTPRLSQTSGGLGPVGRAALGLDEQCHSPLAQSAQQRLG